MRSGAVGCLGASCFPPTGRRWLCFSCHGALSVGLLDGRREGHHHRPTRCLPPALCCCCAVAGCGGGWRDLMTSPAAWTIRSLDGMGAPPAAVVGPAGSYLPPLRRPAAAGQPSLSHAAMGRPSLYSSMRLPAPRPEQASGLALDASGASAAFYHHPADGLYPAVGLTPPFTPTTVAPRPPPPAWRADMWRPAPACDTVAPGTDMYSSAPVPPSLGRGARGPPSSAVGGSSMKRVGEPAEHQPSWPHGPHYLSDLPEYAPTVPPRHPDPAPTPPAALATQLKPLWPPSPAVLPAIPAQADAPAPRTDADLFSHPSSRAPAGHVAGTRRCPTLPALPLPRLGWTPQQRQEQELEELLSSQGDTEQLQGHPMRAFPQVHHGPPVTRPTPPLGAPLMTGVNLPTPHPRAARQQPWWSNPRAPLDEHAPPPVALGLPTLSTTTSGGSALNGVDHKVDGSNPASGALGVVSYLTAPGAVGGSGYGGSSRRAFTDDSCAVDSMRQRSSSDTCLSAGGEPPPAAVADVAYTPPVAAQSPPSVVFPLSRQRVTWTADLRRRFEKALDSAGGIRVATPTAVLDAMTAAADADGVVLPLTRQSVASFLQRQRKRRRDAAAAAAAAASAATGGGARALVGHAPVGGVLTAADAMPAVPAAGLPHAYASPYQMLPMA